MSRCKAPSLKSTRLLARSYVACLLLGKVACDLAEDMQQHDTQDKGHRENEHDHRVAMVSAWHTYTVRPLLSSV